MAHFGIIFGLSGIRTKTQKTIHSTNANISYEILRQEIKTVARVKFEFESEIDQYSERFLEFSVYQNPDPQRRRKSFPNEYSC